jgi:DnaK suppressor protein
MRQRLEQGRERLRQLRDSLTEEVPEDESERVAIVEISSDEHPADVGSEVFERSKDLSIIDDLDSQLADVERALRRIDEGSYGTCEACGGAIGRERLAARPAARFCLEDQARAEREAKAS